MFVVQSQLMDSSVVKTKVAAVLVTFNRSVLLQECLQGLLGQTRPLDKILVVDNCSTDDTQERVLALCTEHPIIEYRRLESNTGGAGGFANVMHWAYELGYEWLWVMDDDVEPFPQGLENLLAYTDVSWCIHGLRMEPDGGIFPWGSYFDEAVVDTRPCFTSLPVAAGAVVDMNVGCFEGMLVHRDVIAQVGLPWEELFITWDDTYFGYLASKVTRVVYARVPSLQRKRSMDRVSAGVLGTRMSMTPMGNYYHHRNRYMLATRLSISPVRFWLRNVLVYGKSMAKELLLTRHWANAMSIHRGTVDGLQYFWRMR